MYILFFLLKLTVLPNISSYFFFIYSFKFHAVKNSKILYYQIWHELKYYWRFPKSRPDTRLLKRFPNLVRRRVHWQCRVLALNQDWFNRSVLSSWYNPKLVLFNKVWKWVSSEEIKAINLAYLRSMSVLRFARYFMKP